MTGQREGAGAQAAKAPRFGLAIRDAWLLEPGIAYLNHGSYGATPRRILETQRAWREALEREPCRFMARTLPPALRDARTALAGYLGARPDDLGFVDNATTAVNAVLASQRLEPGDRVVTTSHVYGAVRNALRHHCGRAGAHLLEVPLPFPAPSSEAILERISAALESGARLAVLDHVTSDSGLVLPMPDLVALCRARGLPLLVDGAHAPGMLPLDLATLGADWYCGNAHKWLCAPKGAGFLWAAPARQTGLHPLVISRGYGRGLTVEFDWQGTRDPSAWLCVAEALAWRAELGEPAIATYCRALATAMARRLAAAWGTEVGTPQALPGFMATVRLPLEGADPDRAKALHDRLLDDHGIECKIVVLAGALWVRLSAFLYNAPADYARLEVALPAALEVCR